MEYGTKAVLWKQVCWLGGSFEDQISSYLCVVELWIMAEISLQAGHEISPSSPTERITLLWSRGEYCLRQSVVA